MLKEALVKAAAGEDLGEREAHAAMSEIMGGAATPAQIAAFITALRVKGETVAEVVGCAKAMREKVVRVRAPQGVVMDTCGTGGDGRGTFNVSTVTALVLAADGVCVAKHGNRAASSKCGSSDLLEALGVGIEQSAEKVEECLRTVGIGYMHAPGFHPAMKYAGPVRRELGFRTIFNMLGPLCNPAHANAQILGVFSPKLVRPFAEVLRMLGSRSAFTFHGAGGLDELSTTGVNTAMRLQRGKISRVSISPSSVGVKRARMKDLAGGDPSVNAEIARSVLEGKKSPYRDAVVLNAAVGLVAAGKARSPREGARRSEDLLDKGLVRRKLEELVSATQGGA